VLNGLNASYQAKVASARRFYPRRDALVVYLDRTALQVIPSLVAALSSLRLGTEVSAFAEPLTAGIGCAWEPRDPRAGFAGMSLGQHRSRVVAEALVAHAAGTADRDRHRALVDAFRAANIDPALPHRNLDTLTTLPNTTAQPTVGPSSVGGVSPAICGSTGQRAFPAPMSETS
jgi:hypothetical protein